MKSTNLDMYIRNVRLTILAVIVLTGTLKAQFGLQTSQLRDHVWSQTYQPANLAEGDFNTFRYAGQAGFWMGNTHAPLKGIFTEGGYISNETKDQLISSLKPNEDVAGGIHLGYAAVNVNIKGRRFGFYLDEFNTASARFNDPNTLGLILKGNGAYAGDTVSDHDIDARLYRVRELAVGTAQKWDRLTFGARLRLKQGIRVLELKQLDYSLFTEANGTNVHAIAEYELNASPVLSKNKLFDLQGFGAAIDLGLRYQLNEKMDIDFAANNLGAMSWKVNHLDESVDLDWKGITVSNLFAGGLSDSVEAQVDSLKAQLLPDTTVENRLLVSPARLRAGFNWKLNEKALLSGNVIWSPIKGGWHSRLPLINATFQYEILNGLKLGANAYGLGLDSYGFGLMGNYHFKAGSMEFDLLAGTDNILGFVAPSIGRGMSVYGGIGISL